MEKTNKFIDPMEKLYAPPPNRTRWEAFSLFFYDPEKGAILGRTPTNWAQLTVFYVIFYACLAAFWAVCMWGLLQTISDDRPTYQLDSSIIGTSPGLASRPIPPEGRESVLSFSNGTWHNTEWPDMLGDFLQEYQNESGNQCDFGYQNDLPCAVDVSMWKDCAPVGKHLNAPCMFFKINKVLEWLPSYYDVNTLPNEMPENLKQVIKATPTQRRDMVWLSCEGKNDADKEKIRNISFYPTQGFPGYYFPFRRQNGYKSPVVAVHFKDIDQNTNIDVECRAWAANIFQDRKEQLGVLNYKLIFEN